MRKDTRFKFNAYLSRVAELNGVDTDDVAKKFTVEPSVTQTLMTTLQASSAFLTKINIVPVDELKGEKVGVGVNGPMTSVRPLISLRSNPTNTNARKSTLISIFVTNSSTCGRVSRTFRPVSVTQLSSVSRSISSWPVSTVSPARRHPTAKRIRCCRMSRWAGCRNTAMKLQRV